MKDGEDFKTITADEMERYIIVLCLSLQGSTYIGAYITGAYRLERDSEVID